MAAQSSAPNVEQASNRDLSAKIAEIVLVSGYFRCTIAATSR
jgi:hypothetical protein